MKKMIYMSVLALIAAGSIFWSCQKDEIAGLSDDELALKKATVTATIVPTFTWTESTCAGEPITFTLTGDGQKQIRMWGLNTITNVYEWLQVANMGNNSSDPLYFNTVLEAGTYYFIYKVGNTWIPGNSSTAMADGISLTIENCGCDDANFGYTTSNENLDIIFKYNHDEVVQNLTIQFTFSQILNSQLNANGKYVGADGKLYDVNNPTNQTVFTWTGPVSCKTGEAETFAFNHAPDCGPSTAKDGQANIWTDAKITAINGVELVDDPLTENIIEGPVSLKGDLPSIVYAGCPKKN